MSSPYNFSRHTFWAIRFMYGYWQNLVDVHGFDGNMTLNEFRIVNMILYGVAIGEPVTNKELSERLNIPQSTVSRIVSKLDRIEWVEQIEVDDGRKRPLKFSKDSVDNTNAWGDFMAAMALEAAREAYEGHAAGTAVLKGTESILPLGTSHDE